MKEPSRQNKSNSSSQQKLKLLCSFNGSFLPHPASRKLCYLGGETRLISVDRSIGYSQLLSKISELCPKLPSLSLKYQLPDSDDDGLYGDLPLVSIETDDDVRCMIEEYDKVADGRRRAKLRIFVCSGGNRHRSGPKTSVARMAGPGSQTKALSGRFRRGWALEDGFASANFHQPVGIVRFPYEAYQSNLCPAMRSFNHLHCNRENIRPSNAGNNQMKSCLLPAAYNNQMDREVYPSTSHVGNCAISGLPPHEIGNIQTGFSSARNCRNRLHDIGNHQYSGFGQRYGGCYPGLKPMLSTSEVQQRSNYAHLANILGGYSENYMFKTANMGCTGKEARSLFNVENSRGILRERVLQPRYEKTLSSHFYGWSDLQENHLDNNCVYCGPLEAGKQHHHLGNCSCLLCDATEKPIPCFAPGYREDQPYYSNVEKCETKSSSLLNKSFKDAFCNFKVGEGGCQYPMKIDDLPSPCSQEIEAGLPCKTLEEVAKEPRDGHDLHDETSVDLSVHKLSSSSSTEVATPKIFCLSINDLGTDGDQPMYGESTTHNSNISARDDASARCEMLPPFTPSDTMDEGRQNMELLMKNLTEVQNHKTDSHTSSSNTSMMDATELKLSGPPSPVVAEVSSSMGRDLAHEEKNQQNASSSFKSKEKANLKGSDCKAEVVGETTSKLTACYAHLATQELQTIKNSDLEEIRELGSGTYGTVFYGKWKGCDVAIKRIKPSCFSGDEHGQDQLIAHFWKEARLLSQLHHPNVVSFYGVVTDGPPNNLSTVTEYMVNGSLKQVLRKKDRTIDRRKRVMIAMDAAFGMEYLHEKNIVHFDLKSHNFLVNMRDPQRPVCKIGDLGLSKVKQKTYVSGGVRGTLPWMAPELLKSKSNLVTEKVDVFSFGIVMWELLAGDEPYAGMSSEEIIAGIIKGDLRPDIPSWCDPAWRSLMERCWSSDPASRPSFSEIAKELRAIAASMNIK